MLYGEDAVDREVIVTLSLKSIAPPLLLSATFVTVTAPLKSTLPVLSVSKVRPFTGVEPPIAPENTISPAPAARLSVSAPSSVLRNEILPLAGDPSAPPALVSRLAAASRTTAPANDRLWPAPSLPAFRPTPPDESMLPPRKVWFAPPALMETAAPLPPVVEPSPPEAFKASTLISPSLVARVIAPAVPPAPAGLLEPAATRSPSRSMDPVPVTAISIAPASTPEAPVVVISLSPLTTIPVAARM